MFPLIPLLIKEAIGVDVCKRLGKPTGLGDVSINSTSYKRSDKKRTRLITVVGMVTLFPLIPLLIKEAILVAPASSTVVTRFH